MLIYLLSFEVFNQGEVVGIKWVTGFEKNGNYFEVLVLEVGVHWDVLGVVKALWGFFCINIALHGG
jgi:hypothetical protein